MDHPREKPEEVTVKLDSPQKTESTFEKRLANYTDQTQYWNADRKSPMTILTDQLPALFTPMQIGNLTLTHRLVLAPLTRMRASAERVPNVELSAEYYRQRATKGGFLISESTSISEQGTAYFRTPGIYTDSQIEAWKSITQAVHDKGAFIVLQLWHVGRVSHSKYQPDGRLPVAPSPIALQGSVRLPDGSTAEYEVPRELRAEDEIPAIIEDYRRATKNSFLAGFDGIEIQAANGYLIDQFLHDGSNKRTDAYGGSIENRCRILFEIVEAVQQAWSEAAGPTSPSSGNVGVRFSPFGTYNNMSDSSEFELFRYIITKINDYKLAFMDINDQRVAGTSTIVKVDSTTTAGNRDPMQELCRLFTGPVILTGGYRPTTANQAIIQGIQSNPPQQVAVAVGRIFISNPDLPLRVLLRAPINHYDRSTFYTSEAVGYTDQPFLKEEEVQHLVDAITLSTEGKDKLKQDLQSYLHLLKVSPQSRL